MPKTYDNSLPICVRVKWWERSTTLNLSVECVLLNFVLAFVSSDGPFKDGDKVALSVLLRRRPRENKELTSSSEWCHMFFGGPNLGGDYWPTWIHRWIVPSYHRGHRTIAFASAQALIAFVWGQSKSINFRRLERSNAQEIIKHIKK